MFGTLHAFLFLPFCTRQLVLEVQRRVHGCGISEYQQWRGTTTDFSLVATASVFDPIVDSAQPHVAPDGNEHGINQTALFFVV
eukprot:6191397-Pleurochrysis_carterae.AAC.1